MVHDLFNTITFNKLPFHNKIFSQNNLIGYLYLLILANIPGCYAECMIFAFYYILTHRQKQKLVSNRTQTNIYGFDIEFGESL